MSVASKIYKGGVNSYTNAGAWTPAGAPQAGDDVLISSGTVSASHLDIESESITLNRYGLPPLVLSLKGVVLGNADLVSSVGEGGTVVINTLRQVRNDGTIRDQFGVLDINVGKVGASSTFVNFGTLDAARSIGSANVDVTVARGSRMSNFGTMLAEGAGPVPGGKISVAGAGGFTNNGAMLAQGGSITASFHGVMTNTGSIEASSPGGATDPSKGTVSISFGQLYTYPHDALVNTGLLEAGQNATFDISAAHASTTYYGEMINRGMIESSGHMTLDTPIIQTGGGEMAAIAGGTLTLNSSVDGGTVVLDRGMLEFGGGGIGFAGPVGAQGFHAALSLEGAADSISFGTIPITEVFADGQLKVYTPRPTEPFTGQTQIADIHLTGGAYSASDFSVVGSTIEYLRPPQG